ncbi:hypothetical protein L210DRAFT_209933, partial [Boletus edulis BED1]
MVVPQSRAPKQLVGQPKGSKNKSDVSGKGGRHPSPVAVEQLLRGHPLESTVSSDYNAMNAANPAQNI